MSWYRFSKDYIESIKASYPKVPAFNLLNTNSIDDAMDDTEANLEQGLDSERKDKQRISPEVLKNYENAKSPNNYFAHGQGGDYRMQEGRDLVWNQTPDNFINMSEWNT